jgi:small subunit ribosomal protein S27Ae
MADKKTIKKKKSSQKYKAYKVEGGKLVRKNKNCPKCGKGVLLAEHKDRITCGACGYMEKK